MGLEKANYDKTFTNYFEAIVEAGKNNANVIEIATGIVRWQPAAKVSKAKMREYKNRLNAYNAQKEN